LFFFLSTLLYVEKGLCGMERGELTGGAWARGWCLFSFNRGGGEKEKRGEGDLLISTIRAEGKL